MAETLRILALSGSLRQQSSTTKLLQVASKIAPAAMQIELYTAWDALPHFNPEREDEPGLSGLAAWQAALAATDGLLICCPEYAHGVPGAFKNAFDWVVGSGELVDKPIALINASPMAVHADAALRETLTVMSARVAPPMRIPLEGKQRTVAELTEDSAFTSQLLAALKQFREFI